MTSAQTNESQIVKAGTVVSVLTAIAGAWIAAESTGLLDDPLRRVLIWITIGVCLLADQRGRKNRWSHSFLLLTTVVVAVAMVASPFTVVNVLAIALILAVMARVRKEEARRLYANAVLAVSVLAIYGLARTSIPIVWIAADRFGQGLGTLAGAITSQPLRIGATFSGIDFLIVTIVLWLGWLQRTGITPRRLTSVAIGIGTTHLLYLILLSFASLILNLVPDTEAKVWTKILDLAVPWHLPSLGALMHLIVFGAVLCRSTRTVNANDANHIVHSEPHRGRQLASGATIAIAILLPVITILAIQHPELEGKKIVLYEKGFLNWLKPEHGEYGSISVGMYGMLPAYLESLGAHCVRSPDLSEGDLDNADALILIFPDEPWEEGQLERIWNFSRQGGSVLMLGEHTIREENGGSRFNEMLKPTDMRVRFDSATFAVGGWLKSYEVPFHPVTAGIPDDRNQFGMVIGATVQTEWPARPLLVGRWGWADAGDVDGTAMMGNGRYDSGEKLGDLVLASEQQFDKGTVMCFGDPSGFTNGITVGSHLFTSRLMGYVTGSHGPHSLQRQLLGLLAAILLIWMLAFFQESFILVMFPIAMTASLVFCQLVNTRTGEVLPDGRRQSPNNLAYISSSHLESHSGESWRQEGSGGLELTLMRNGFLTLDLPQLTSQRLQRAGLLVSVAPSKAFTPAEREMIRQFIEDGGIFISIVGYPDAGPSTVLLSELGFEVGTVVTTNEDRIVEPQPLGYFKVPYLETDNGLHHVRFHAAWPVAFVPEDAQVVAMASGNKPVVVYRRIGNGKAVVIGDTSFAMNKNLENESGAPFEGLRENADFWRWFLTILRDQPQWIPEMPSLFQESENNQETFEEDLLP